MGMYVRPTSFVHKITKITRLTKTKIDVIKTINLLHNAFSLTDAKDRTFRHYLYLITGYRYTTKDTISICKRCSLLCTYRDEQTSSPPGKKCNFKLDWSVAMSTKEGTHIIIEHSIYTYMIQRYIAYKSIQTFTTEKA